MSSTKTTTSSSSSSPWWYCGSCAFKNHPRLGQDSQKCEQCGASRTDAELAHADYTPAA